MKMNGLHKGHWTRATYSLKNMYLPLRVDCNYSVTFFICGKVIIVFSGQESFCESYLANERLTAQYSVHFNMFEMFGFLSNSKKTMYRFSVLVTPANSCVFV